MTSWEPLPKMACATITKPFLPLNKQKALADDRIKKNFKNVYPGDLIYLFEIENASKKWVRGYLASQTFPSDLSSATVSLEKLPEIKVSVVIVPMSHVRIEREFTADVVGDVYLPMADPDFNDKNYPSDTSDIGSLLSSTTRAKAKIPPFPVYDQVKNTKSLPDEIFLCMKTTFVQIYALYTKGDFEHAKKLIEVYNQIYDIRVNVIYNLYTLSELAVAKRQTAALLTSVSKIYASANTVLGDIAHFQSKDICGYQAILSRDSDTGELIKFKTGGDSADTLVNTGRLALNQMFYALAPNFPVANAELPLYPAKNKKFEPTYPSHILIDFHQVVGATGIVPKGYAGMTAYVYLRNSKKRLTEGYAIQMEPGQDISLDNLSGALFCNVPATEVDAGRIYLVALVTETIKIETTTSSNNVPTLKSIRRGICAGAVDISRIFSRRKGHLSAGEAHQFTMKLYASYMTKEAQSVQIYPGMNPMLAMSLTMANNGWGELVDRIISGSNKGVAINPRAEKLIVSVKEVTQEAFDNGVGTFSAIDLVKTMFYNPLEEAYCRIYMRCIRCYNIPCFDEKDKQFITVDLGTSSKSLKFSKGTNETPKSTWQFLSTSPDEHICETIQITGLSPSPTNENDFLYFDVYSSGQFVGSGKYPLRVYNQIADTGINSRKVKNIELFSPTSSQPVGSVEIDLEYTGKNYNVDTYVEMILNWRSIFEKNISNTDKNLIATLGKLRRVGLNIIIKFFPELIENLLEIYSLANDKHQLLSVYGSARETKFQALGDAAFDCIVHLLDLAIARQDQYVYLFNKLMERQFPQIGEYLVADLNRYLKAFNEEWNSTGRAICRVSVLVLRIAASSICDNASFVSTATEFAGFVSEFLNSSKESFISDQLILVENLELILEALRDNFDDIQLVRFVESWTTSMGMKGLGALEESSNNALMNKKKNKQHRFIINKLYFLIRTLHSFLVDTESKQARELLYSNALSSAFEIILGKTIDIDASRLALSVILSAMSTSFGSEKRFFDESYELYLIFARMYAPLAGAFCEYVDHCFAKGMLKPKRSFTQLFSTVYPFQEFTMDSSVNDESFCEILIEFNAVLVFAAHISWEINDVYDRIWGKGEPYPVSYTHLDDFLGAPESVTGDLMSILKTNHAMRLMADPTYYPGPKWISLKATSIHINEIYQEYFSSLVLKMLPPQLDYPERFPKKVYLDFVVFMLKCADSKPASLEHLSIIVRKACYNLMGGIRGKTMRSVYRVWEALGRPATAEEKQRFGLEQFGAFQKVIYSEEDYGVILELLVVAMQRSDTCLELGTKMFWSIIVSEWVDNGSLYELERSTISSLYEIFFHRSRYSPEITEIKSFIGHLKTLVTLEAEDEAYQPVMQFVNTLFEFLTTAAEMKKIPDGQEFDDDRTFYKINVAGYLMNVDKPELLQSFISSMYESYLSKKDFVQAALSLELLANTYNWDTSSFLPACAAPRFPSQSEFKRKEALFKLIASNFNKGGKVEQAIDCYQELLDAFSKYNFDLKGLSFCHTELAKGFNSLETVGRMESSFFKISYIGFGFPNSIRGKEFIYEGLPFEHITSINHRLSRKYPGSRIISNEDEAKRLLVKTPFGKFLHIKTVTPYKHSNDTHMTFMAKQYVDSKNLNTFVSTRRIPGSTNVNNLWTEEITYESFLTFPTLMNRSEIKTTHIVRLSPIKNAVKSLIAKNEELAALEFLIKQNLKEGIDAKSIASSSAFNNLSRILSGTVDSPVNGGVGQYRAFFNAKSDEPDFDLNVKYLMNSFNSLITLLNKLLKLHHALIPPSLKPQHQAMVELFTKNFGNEIAELKLDVKSTINLERLLESLITTKIHSRRYRQRLANLDLDSSNYGSSYYNQDDDDSSSFTGSNTGSNTGSGSKLSIGIASSNNSSSRFTSSTNATGGTNGQKKTILNFK